MREANPETRLQELLDEVQTFESDPSYPADPYVLISLEEAIVAAEEGNAGVGALLVDPDGNIAHRDRNRMFHSWPITGKSCLPNRISARPTARRALLKSVSKCSY